MTQAQTPFTSIAIVDASLPDLATLLASLPKGVEVHLMEPGTDGVQLLADTLQGRSGIEAIHLLTHGSAGSLSLGSNRLTSATLENHSDQWATVRNALTADADILIYGCDVGAGQAGQDFVAQLAQWTGADIAASDDLTGAAALGGDSRVRQLMT